MYKRASSLRCPNPQENEGRNFSNTIFFGSCQSFYKIMKVVNFLFLHMLITCSLSAHNGCLLDAWMNWISQSTRRSHALILTSASTEETQSATSETGGKGAGHKSQMLDKWRRGNSCGYMTMTGWNQLKPRWLREESGHWLLSSLYFHCNTKNHSPLYHDSSEMEYKRPKSGQWLNSWEIPTLSPNSKNIPPTY